MTSDLSHAADQTAAPLKTPLYEAHVGAGAKVIDFGGWLMPVQYTSIMDEHNAVRQHLGLFDISHMGEVFVSGPNAATWLDSLLTNHVAKLAPGHSHYTFLLNDEGGIIDDLLVYHVQAGLYLLIVNASKIGEDVAWLRAHLAEGVTLEDKSPDYAGLAIQGPQSVPFFQAFAGAELPPRNQVVEITREGVSFYVARTGYTGEDGFELFFEGTHAATVWNALLATGAAFGMKPCGLGARDTLRLEMCYPLNGSDLSAQRSPLEAGLGFFVDLEKGDFIGRAKLLAQKAEGVAEKLVPFRMTGKCPPPRSHYTIYKGGEAIGETTSGSLSPSLSAGIGMAYLPASIAKAGEEIEIDIRGRRFPAVIERKPLYRK